VNDTCAHLDDLALNAPPSGPGCFECTQIGAPWLHLRRCIECGHVGCCDQSPNRHATEHFHGTTHPLIQSYEPGEDWLWCYVDEFMFEVPALSPSSSHP
jgi:hypothetical protein